MTTCPYRKLDFYVSLFTVDGHLYVLCCYVDDCCLVGVAGPFIAKFKADFGKRFKIEDLGPVCVLVAGL